MDKVVLVFLPECPNTVQKLGKLCPLTNGVDFRSEILGKLCPLANGVKTLNVAGFSQWLDLGSLLA